MLFSRNNTWTKTCRPTSPGLQVRPLHRPGLTTSWVTRFAFCLWAALSLSVALAQVPASGPASAPLAGALVSEWKGEVSVQLPGTNPSAPKRGQVLPAGTTLETKNGRLMLVLRADESEILVQPHTRLVIVDPAPGYWNALEVAIGRIRAYIRKRTGGAPPFQMGTPSAVIAVRGTRFDVEVNKRGVSEVDVFDGLVEVASNVGAGSPVLVSPGFSTRVGMLTPPETPVPTGEIRPGVEAPEEMAKLEFSRERAAQADRTWESELGERPDSEVDESVDESRESEKEKH